MSWFLHHVNIPAHDVRASVEFYSDVLGMREDRFDFISDHRSKFDESPDSVAKFFDGSREIHICKPTPEFAQENNMFLHPIQNGHLAICVDDMDRVRRRLEARNAPYFDAGQWAVAGREQLYFYDPSMNVVEVNTESGS